MVSLPEGGVTTGGSGGLPRHPMHTAATVKIASARNLFTPTSAGCSSLVARPLVVRRSFLVTRYAN